MRVRASSTGPEGRVRRSFRLAPPLLALTLVVGATTAPQVDDLDSIFRDVALGVRYEPYAGVLRGGELTALARSGNAYDQSLLLAGRLTDAGYRARFARGRLDADNAAVLLRGMYPPRTPAIDGGGRFAPYDPASDAEALDLVSDHVWVEVFQGDGWLPLDPSFPRAIPGEAYARVTSRMEAIPDALHQRVRIVLKEELRGSGVRELDVLEGRASELGLRPISLVMRNVPLVEAGAPRAGGSPARTFGAFGGALSGRGGEEEEPEPAPAVVVGSAVQRTRSLGAALTELPSTVLQERGSNAPAIVGEWLEITLTAPGSEPTSSVRHLGPLPGTADPEPPAAERHYAIAVVPGPVPRAWLAQERARLARGVDLAEGRRRLAAASATDPADEDADGLSGEVAAAGERAGAVGLHLMALTHAAESDAMSRGVAAAAGVTMTWPVPRVLIASVETREREGEPPLSRVALDLRVDRVGAHPLPGGPAKGVPLFRTARGIQNSVLEGRVVAAATGLDEVSTTARVMERAWAEDVPMLSVLPGDRAALDQVQNLPRTCRGLLESALARDREVILPVAPVRVAGRARWGWWEIDPVSGHAVGVMEDGLHQSLVDYTVDLKEVGLNDKMGLVIGGIIGGTATLFTISAFMLEYGEASEAMVAAVEAFVQSLGCMACPTGAEAKAGASAGSSYGNECFSAEVMVERSIEAKATIGLCEQYAQGFSCVSGILLNGLKGNRPLESGGSTSAQAGASASIGCAEAKAGVSLSGDGLKAEANSTITG